MSYVVYPEVMYVAQDGNYGGGSVIITSFENFTDEQLEILDTLGDNDRFDYAYAVLNGEDTSEWED